MIDAVVSIKLNSAGQRVVNDISIRVVYDSDSKPDLTVFLRLAPLGLSNDYMSCHKSLRNVIRNKSIILCIIS